MKKILNHYVKIIDDIVLYKSQNFDVNEIYKFINCKYSIEINQYIEIYNLI